MSEHTHSVVDSDNRFTLDPITRKLTTVSTKKILAQGDHRSEVFTFELPRYIEGHDMSLCNSAQVHFTNTEGKQPKRSCSDVWEASDLTLDGDKVTFSWAIENTATKYAGALAFSIKMQCIGVDSELGYVVEYEYNSLEYTKISIAQALSNIESAVEESTSLLSSFKDQVVAEAADSLKITMEDYISQAEDAAQRAADSADEAEAVTGLTIDTALNEASANPVQNKVVKKAIDDAKSDMQGKIEQLEGSKGIANGLATLDATGKVPTAQLPSMDYVPTSDKGVADGVATLDSGGKVPSSQLPDMDYIPTLQKNAANGVAGLDASGKVPADILPENVLLLENGRIPSEALQGGVELINYEQAYYMDDSYVFNTDSEGNSFELKQAYLMFREVTTTSSSTVMTITAKHNGGHSTQVSFACLDQVEGGIPVGGYLEVVDVGGYYKVSSHFNTSSNVGTTGNSIYSESAGVTEIEITAVQGNPFATGGTISLYGVRA